MNIVLVSLDTTRADRLSCYGHFRRTSPHIDRIAAEGALFLEHYSPHIPTFPGHTTMLTGQDLYTHQISSQSAAPELSSGIPMLAELFAAQGYFTGAVDNLGRWFARGFTQTWAYRWDTTESDGWRKGEAVTAAALQALDTAAGQDRPFLLFVHYWDPHTPYLPPAPFSRMFYGGDERDPANRSMDPVWAFENFRWYFDEWMPGVTDIEFPKAQYDAEIAYMDACLTHLVTRLDRLRLSSDTLLVLTADHGEDLDEHGCWFDHHGLYDTNIHIPLILRLPGKIPAGTRIGGLTRMQDLTPTLLDYAGLLDPALRFDGTSLKPLIDLPAPTARGTCDVLYCTENTWMKKRAVRTHNWKLIVPLETPDLHGNSEVELYHLTVDPQERHNVASERPDEVRQLSRLMDDWTMKRLQATGNADPVLTQPIPLRRIGRSEQAPARDTAGDEAVIVEAGPNSIPLKVPSDDKLETGDFVGYERDADS